MYKQLLKSVRRLTYRKFLLITILAFCLIFFFNLFMDYGEEELFGNENLKYVQLLTYRFDGDDWALDQGLGEAAFRNCPEKRCFAIKPTLLQTPLEKSDAIMVHGPNLLYLPSRTKYKRSRKQIWLYYTLESPRGTKCSMHYKPTDLDDWFNLTITYKTDSDLVANFDKKFNTFSDLKTHPEYLNEFKNFYLQSNKQPVKTLNDLSAKNGKVSVAWFVSHCETNSRRENYVKEMLNYIDIDIYGKCESYFPNVLTDSCKSVKNKKDCNNKLFDSYKFYLSFENSLCDDYITEKYWKFYSSSSIFYLNIVPIVRGARIEQYEKVAPSNSLIYADKFKSPKELANYLIYLNKNESAYLEYFKWKIDLYNEMADIIEKGQKPIENTSPPYGHHTPFCFICSILHNKTYMENENNKIWHIGKWFDEKTSCWDQDEPRRLFYWATRLIGYCF